MLAAILLVLLIAILFGVGVGTVHFLIWLAVADMDETLKQVTRHGGQILEPPAPDGPTRILATIADSEGNPIGLAGHAPGA